MLNQPALFDTEPPAARATRLPDDWQPSVDDLAFADLEGFTPDEAERIAAQFADYWHSEPGARARKHSWKLAWRVWCRREAEWRARRGGVQRGGLASGMAAALRYGARP